MDITATRHFTRSVACSCWFQQTCSFFKLSSLDHFRPRGVAQHSPCQIAIMMRLNLCASEFPTIASSQSVPFVATTKMFQKMGTMKAHALAA
eukprot:5988967-Amphidinium_carterae.2